MYTAALETRLLHAVQERLGSKRVTFERWERDRQTGADVPVFGVPADLTAHAAHLGLTFDTISRRQA